MFSLQLTLGKEKCCINYAYKVFQGDNASPICFLFVMMVATDSFMSAFQLEDKLTFNYFPIKANARKQNGRLKGQCTRAALSKSKTYYMSMAEPSHSTTKMTLKD